MIVCPSRGRLVVDGKTLNVELLAAGIRKKADALMETISRSLAESGSESASSEETGGPNREGDDTRISRLPDGGAS